MSDDTANPPVPSPANDRSAAFENLSKEEVCGILLSTAWVLKRLPALCVPSHQSIRQASELLDDASALHCRNAKPS